MTLHDAMMSLCHPNTKFALFHLVDYFQICTYHDFGTVVLSAEEISKQIGVPVASIISRWFKAVSWARVTDAYWDP